MIIKIPQQEKKSPIEILRLDRRLRSKIITKNPVFMDFERLTKWTNKYAHVFICLENDPPRPLVFHIPPTSEKNSRMAIFSEIECGDLMDAYALHERGCWRRLPKQIGKTRSNDYEYRDSLEKEADNILNSPRQQRMAIANAAFMQYVGGLPKEEKDKVFSGKPLDFSQLPNNAQDSFRKMGRVSEDDIKELSGKNYTQGFDPENFTSGTISITNMSREGGNFAEYTIRVSSDKGGIGFYTTDYKPGSSSATPPNCTDVEYRTDNTSQNPKIRKHKKLSQKTSVNLPLMNIESAAIVLQKQWDINFFMDHLPPAKLVRKPFTVNQKPLWEALDTLCEVYGGWEWEYSESNFVILRAPNSPQSRHPQGKPKK
jgi:hypothetical protein